jgi:hypothetical protein
MSDYVFTLVADGGVSVVIARMGGNSLLSDVMHNYTLFTHSAEKRGMSCICHRNGSVLPYVP